MIKSMSEVYETGARDERTILTARLEKEIETLKQYGRTELWGLHKAIAIINEREEEE
jgi:hypothetical protein